MGKLRPESRDAAGDSSACARRRQLQANLGREQYPRMSDESAPTVLYPFKLRNERTGNWRLARWKASLEEVERLGGEVCGDPVIYHPQGNTSNFVRNMPVDLTPPAVSLEMHPHWESPPAIDPLERSLARTFLRRYSTWCVRTRRYAQAQGAAALHRELA